MKIEWNYKIVLYIRYGQFWIILLEHFVECTFLISEEWYQINILGHNFFKWPKNCFVDKVRNNTAWTEVQYYPKIYHIDRFFVFKNAQFKLRGMRYKYRI